MVEYRIFLLEIINGESTSSVMTFSHKWPPLNSRLTQTSLKKKKISICSPSRQAQVEVVTWCGGSYNTIRSSFSVSHLPFFNLLLFSYPCGKMAGEAPILQAHEEIWWERLSSGSTENRIWWFDGCVSPVPPEPVTVAAIVTSIAEWMLMREQTY